MSTPTVEKVALPAGTLVARAFPRLDYADAYRVRLPTVSPHNLDRAVYAALGSAPRWVMLLMRLRDLLVGTIGLKTTPHAARRDLSCTSLRPGDRLGLFKVFERTEDELLLGQDDRHLDFRVSVLMRNDGVADWAIVSTVVRFNNWLGRVYFLPVCPLHRLIVPAMLRNALRIYSNHPQE